MSLDVYLTRDKWISYDEGKTHEIEKEELYWANITHNLNMMAEEAGIYKHLWRPEEIGVTKARQLIQPLLNGLALLKGDPDRFTPHNASNGWGMYEHFVPFVEEYLHACIEYSSADIRVSR